MRKIRRAIGLVVLLILFCYCVQGRRAYSEPLKVGVMRLHYTRDYGADSVLVLEAAITSGEDGFMVKDVGEGKAMVVSWEWLGEEATDD